MDKLGFGWAKAGDFCVVPVKYGVYMQGSDLQFLET